MGFSKETFTIVFDYVVFAMVLVISLGIGLYYSFRQKTTEEYVHGGHKMGLIPASVSLVVSYVSAMTLQGIPAEVYMYGIEIIFTLFAAAGMLIVIFTFLPIYYELKPTSIFEYLEARFDSSKPKLLGTWLSVLSGTMYAGIISFGPASAIESLTGIPTEYNIVAMAVICTIYTSVGGIKAVIWTDVFQAGIMLIGLLVVIVVGTIETNVDTLWEDMSRYGRTDLHLNPKLTQRSSVWIFVFISAIQRFAMFIDQPAMIRYTGLPTIRQAKASIVLSMVGFVILMILSMAVGIIVLGYYAQKGCGPLEAGHVYTSNQIVPFFIIDVVNYPGIPGLFISAIVASTLSSVSSTQNAVGTIFWKDVLSKLIQNASEFKKTLILKLTVIVFGLITMGISFLAMYAGGTLFHASASVLGIVSSPPLGMFLLGACFTFTSSTASIIGCVCSIAFCMWISLGKLFYGTVWDKPPLIDDVCNVYINSTSNYSTIGYNQNIDPTTSYFTNVTSLETEEMLSGLSQLYSISAYAYPAIGSGLTFIIGLILSILPCLRHRKPVDPKLLFPFVRRFVKDPAIEEKLCNIDESLKVPLQHSISATKTNKSLG